MEDSSYSWAPATLWETQMKHVVPDFCLVSPWLLCPLGEWTCKWKTSNNKCSFCESALQIHKSIRNLFILMLFWKSKEAETDRGLPPTNSLSLCLWYPRFGWAETRSLELNPSPKYLAICSLTHASVGSWVRSRSALTGMLYDWPFMVILIATQMLMLSRFIEP